MSFYIFNIRRPKLLSAEKRRVGSVKSGDKFPKNENASPRDTKLSPPAMRTDYRRRDKEDFLESDDPFPEVL